ncbi:MAG TPA: DUF2721 domain-containing protein [Candidatus Acidoferrum sp.]|nr:DUF2721 domain-containing protein [Candidatus Acidoferrum sp.]
MLTFIVAPAILTNATSVLAMSTINRMLRTRERMQQLYAASEGNDTFRGDRFINQVNRVEMQAVLLLGAMRFIYVSLGAFAAAALVTLLGAVLSHIQPAVVTRLIIGAGLFLGFVGVAGLVIGCLKLFRATRLSMFNIREEAELIRQRQAEQRAASRQ